MAHLTAAATRRYTTLLVLRDRATTWLVSRQWPYHVAFAGGAVATFALLLFLSRHLTFIADDWAWIDVRMQPSIDAWMKPHNEHWSFVPVVAYEAVFALFGLRTHLPYAVVLTVIHILAAAGVYRLVAIHAGWAAGLACGIVMLLLGQAFGDLVWSFQTGFVGSTAAGVWALVAMSGTAAVRPPGRSVLATTVLLCAAVASSGIGLFFVGAAWVWVVLDVRRRPFAIAPLVATVLYVAWYLAFGRGSLHQPITLESLRLLPAFVAIGAAAAFAGALGVTRDLGLIVALVFGVRVAWLWLRHRRVDALALAALAGIVIEYVLIGLTRARFGTDRAGISRYVYPSAAFALIALAATLGLPRTARASARRLVLPALAVASVVVNLGALRIGAGYYFGLSQDTRAIVAAVETYGGRPGVAQDRSLFPLPTIGRVRAIVAQAGSPTHDSLVPDPPSPSAAARDHALFVVLGGRFTASPAQAEGAAAAPPVVDVANELRLTRDATGCMLMTAYGPDPYVVFRVPDGGRFSVRSASGGDAQVFLSRDAPPQERDSIHVVAAPGQAIAVQLPKSGDAAAWLVRLDPPVAADGDRLCVGR